MASKAGLLGRTDGLLALVAASASLALYLRTMLPTVGIGDTAEFQYVAATMGVAHPTGYPLYVFLGKLFTFLPLGNEAYRVNLMSGVFGAGSVGLLFLGARLAGASAPTALFGAAAFAVAPIPWSWSTLAKMYSLQTFLTGLIVLFGYLWSMGAVSLLPAALTLGLTFGNHRGIVLWLPSFAVFWFLVRRPSVSDFGRTRITRPGLKLLAAVTLPSLMYLYIPFHGIPGHTDFWETLNYAATGSSLIAQIEMMARDPWASSLSFFGEMTPAQFGVVTLPAFLGVVLLLLGLPKDSPVGARRAGTLLALAYAGIIAFHLRVYGGDITGFMLPTFWILGIGLAVSADAAARLIRAASSSLPGVFPNLATGLALAAALWVGPREIALANFASRDLSGDHTHEQRANQLLNALEPNSVLVLNDDWLLIWQIKYQWRIAGVRSDVNVVEGHAETILRAMMERGRPAYAMNYVPGLADEGRLLPVLSFWRATDRPLQFRYGKTIDALFDDRLRLGSWAAPDRTLIPGGLLPVILDWEALTDIDTDYVVFVHLLDKDGRSPAGWDTQPFGYERPTSTWKQGERVADPHGLLLPRDLAPGRYQVEVGLYPEGSSRRLPVVVDDGTAADRVLFGPFRVGVGPNRADPSRPMSARFDQTIRLIGIDRTDRGENGTLPVTLYWQADRDLSGDYTVTVQLLDSAGRLVAQRDSQPVEGRYPTSIWAPGETIVDFHRIPVAGLAAGQYRLITALYDNKSRRLPVGDSNFLDLGLVSLP